MAPSNLLQGQAGVYRVASELMLRGFNPCFPAVDDGVDLFIDEGIRIQVKAAHLRLNSVFPEGAYWYKMHQSARVSGNHTIRKSRARKYSDFCDFVVLWGIEGNHFWIAPSAAFDGVHCVALNPTLPAWHDLDVNGLRVRQEQGKTHDEIADEFGVSRKTVSRRLKGLYVRPSPKRMVTSIVRTGLNRWDLIEAHLRLLRLGDGTQESSTLKEKEIRQCQQIVS
jgi:hypothetical protein